jgi:hypothetical protein
MQPATREVIDDEERQDVLRSAWRRFTPITLLSHVLFAVSWFVGRRYYSGREIDRTTRGLVIAKDALIVASVASGVASIASGEVAGRQMEGERPALDEEGEETTSRRSDVARRVSMISGVVNIVALAGAIGVTAVLAMKAGESVRWSWFSRRAP